jgi:superfamily II DNA or RNA helicase/HKD family nuclease
MSQVVPGLYHTVVTQSLEHRLANLDPRLLQRGRLEDGDAHEVLARHLAALTRQALRQAGGDEADPSKLAQQIELANRMAVAIADAVGDPSLADPVVETANELLTAVARNVDPNGKAVWPDRPETPLNFSALLINAAGEPGVGSEIGKELASADHVYLICAFITWPGVRIFTDRIRDLVSRGAKLCVITTTYMGATEKAALDRLVELGAEVRISYDSKSTRLHAKAWLFQRDTGFHTAYVGSSNLTRTAQTTGLEWNVRLSAMEQPHLITTFAAAFEEYWRDPEFAEYLPERDGDELARALTEAREGRKARAEVNVISPLEVRPYGFQREILEELEAERDIHDRWRNLVVMATGTGKTVVSGIDFHRLRSAGKVETLLFVAHREEILAASLATFRQIVRDGAFGELLVGRERPQRWRHVFASIQSITNVDELDPEHFDMVIIDEFHHASADSYRRLIDRLSPRVLLGLTATPERADGQDIRVYFGGRLSAELRLWEALERELLSPFQYFGIADDVDISRVEFRRRGGYDIAELSNVYTGNDARVRLILAALQNVIGDPHSMKALGFCVSVEHAEYMARKFVDANIAAIAITGNTPDSVRRSALSDLESGKVKCLFSVDLFNEGIDVPAIDTILMLRPTESATIFLQQLGRGLRRYDGKACLTVLDFISNQAHGFRFDVKYRALNGMSRRAIVGEVEEGFPTLPPGCHISLDAVAAQHVLRNVRESLSLNWRELVAETAGFGEVPSLAAYLSETGIELEDVYRAGRGGWTQLLRDSGRRQGTAVDPSVDKKIGKALGRMLHTDDEERLGLWADLTTLGTLRRDAATSHREARLAAMLHAGVFGGSQPQPDLASELQRLLKEVDRVRELGDLAEALRERIHRVTRPVDPDGPLPLHLHARYSRNEALAAFGMTSPRTMVAGVKWFPEDQADVFFVTLRKSERHFSHTTRYADHAITPDLFQWESQNRTDVESEIGQRYINHESLGTSVHLFLREFAQGDGNLGAPPFLYAGPMTYVEHTGNRPIRFVWRLHDSLPADVFHAAKVTTG